MSPHGFKLPVPVSKAVKRLSKFLGAKRPSPDHAFPIAPSPLTTAVPIDIIDEILLHLPAQDILRMKQASRALADLISTSPLLEYRLEVFAAGLVENPRFPCSLEEGRRRVKRYTDVWENLDTIKSYSHPLRLRDFRWEELIPVGRDLLARRSGRRVSFIRVTADRREVEEWTVDPPATPFWPGAFAVYPPEHVLALVEWRRPVFRIRLLNAKDGSPHHLPLNHVILWDTGLDNEGVDVPCAKMTASRLMILVFTDAVNVLIVWDWKTGDVVLRRSSVEDLFLWNQYPRFTFLDEFRLLTSTGQPTIHDDELSLVVFDTSLPQRSPDSWRRLNIAPKYHHEYVKYPSAWEVLIHTDGNRPLGKGSCDGPFIVDPTQSVVAMVLIYHEVGDFPGGEVVLVVPAAALVRRMSPTPSGSHIPWDDWKRDVMVVDIPRHVSHVRTFVHGTRVLLMTYSGTERYSVQAYDFSRWGCRALVRVGYGEMERMVMPNPEKVLFPRVLSHGGDNIRALGDGLVICAYEKNLASPSDIYVWELV